ncbi:MAG: TnpV protein [Ruminiclostridium sp.]|nr:TnpV protein [Ruminiclostridium sp.]
MIEKMNPTGQILSETEYTRSPQIAELLKRPIGRWGRMWKEWIRLEYPQEMQIYIMDGKWQLIPRQIDEEAEKRFNELDKLYRQQNPRPKSFLLIREWEKMRLLTVEHQVMQEVVFLLRM